MSARRLLYKLLVIVVVLGVSFAPLQPVLLLSPRVEAQGVAPAIGAANTGLYRTRVLVRTARDRARLEEMGVVVLEMTPPTPTPSLPLEGGGRGWECGCSRR